MDFKLLQKAGSAGAPTEPRSLFEQLPSKQPGFGYLRDVQAQVLTEWHKQRGHRDTVVKVNTGGGKTINGLVILQSYLNEGLGPSLYVAPNKYLEEQVVAEAAKLGIPVVTDPDDGKYLNSRAICIVNAHKLFNGRTVFSDNRASRPTAPIGAVVVDDAHAALATVRESLSLQIPSSSAVHQQILELFASELKQQSPDTFADICENAYSEALLRVPFWAVREKEQRLRDILRQETTSPDQALYWSWPAVQGVLAVSRIVVTSKAITITPPCPPVGHVTSFATAKRRVYLSATLSDDSVLVTEFGADPASVADPILPTTSGDIGERMILAPQEISPELSVAEIRDSIKGLSTAHNTVVIVPSKAAAQEWDARADLVATSTEEIAEAVADLKSGRHLGLVVLTNRYDGIDLPQEACRVLVLDGLPGAFSGEDRLESMLTSRETGIDDRQVQRLEQGMGRAVRSNEDYCVVFLIGAKLAHLTVDPRTLERFSPATREQLKLSQEMAATLDGQSLTEIVDTARQALQRNPDWITLAKQRLAGILPEPGSVAAHASLRREAFDAAFVGDYGTASSLLARAVDAIGNDDPKLRGWLREQHAVYLDHLDPVQAQDVLRIAKSENRHATRPLTPTSFRRIESAEAQVDACISNIASMFGSPGSALRLGIESILEDLAFDPARTDDFEEAMLRLGLILGLGSQRPEAEWGHGPDNLWALGSGQYWVIEAKSGAGSSKIGKRDAGQLAEAMLWFDKRYSDTCEAVPVMVHKADTLYKDASAPIGCLILNEAGLLRLKTNVRAFSAGLAAADRVNPATVGSLLAGHHLVASELRNYLRPVKS
ncbi:DEAD/DEAH box helicase family protein [Gordonia amicalis]|uniref:DEAD/DEAH box helicase n=1 Tax=Gordonia amicalis TaxID=89053 RepID=UPI0022A7C671|nr:DEAD/DEAH box helicase family protein [Gordonia amicalis]MCZ0914939.1 DEAD/DEAH box helicase family protein [Gordonia amicalis]